jgi:hypothetical protein
VTDFMTELGSFTTNFTLCHSLLLLV